MALAPNATMTFTAYNAEDGGVRFRFVCSNPGGGEPSDYDVLIDDVELVQVTTNGQLSALVTAAMNRKYRAAGGISVKLDPLIGQAVVI